MSDTDSQNQNQVKIVTLSTGETLNNWCLSQFNDLVTNQEVIWDVINVITKLVDLEVVKNQDGFVTDIKLRFPCVSEDIVLFALRNFMEYQSLRESDSLSAETTLELRRNSLKKCIEGKQQ